MTTPVAPVAAGLRRPPSPALTGEVTRLVPRGGEASETPAPVQGALALDAAHPTRRPDRPRLVAVEGPGRPADCAEDSPPDPEVRAWAARFAQAVVEVAGGDRPLPQLLRWTSPRVYAELGRRVRVMAQSRPVEQRRRTLRPQVRSVHVCRPLPTVAEVSVHVRHGRRSRAIAARLELRADRWTCTALRIG
ncbi:MAG TPA: Rv3235 family protein [Nocardioides sp.]|nr:Rv3235 family protein [Nocardioides sp.]